MARGGKRKGAGRPSTWSSGCTREDTVPIRIPKHLKDKVFDYAHRLDAGEDLDCVVKSLEEKVKQLESDIKAHRCELRQLSLLEISDLPDNHKRLYKLRDKILSRGVGKFASTAPIVKDVKKKFTEFIKALYNGDY